MGKLTTHILDTAQGKPAANVEIALYRLMGEAREMIAGARTNKDGRCPAPLLEGESFEPGTYELVFHAGDYFRDEELLLPDPPFLDVIPIRFGISDRDAHYHVPLLLSPFGYSTYRGS